MMCGIETASHDDANENGGVVESAIFLASCHKGKTGYDRVAGKGSLIKKQ